MTEQNTMSSPLVQAKSSKLISPLLIVVSLAMLLIGLVGGFVLAVVIRGNSAQTPTPTPTATPTAEVTATATPLPKNTVELFYYNRDKDELISENVPSCDPKYDPFVSVSREIPLTTTPIKDTLELLLKGELTTAEKAAGFETEFPLDGFSVKSVVLKDGVLTVEFNDQFSKSNGGSCRTFNLQMQIEKTLKQFSEVTEIKYVPEYGYFQP